MPIIKGFQTLICHIENKVTTRMLMGEINYHQEFYIDSGKTITLVYDGVKFEIEPVNVMFYGQVDFNTNSKDYKVLEQFNWLRKITTTKHIPADYDYKTHTCNSPIKAVRYTETSNIAKACQYIHGVLGKPERVILFKVINDKR